MIRAINRVIDFVFVLIVLLVALIAFYVLYDAIKVANGSELGEDIVAMVPSSNHNNDDFDLNELKGLNPNIIG